MNIVLNGEPAEIKDGEALSDIVKRLKLDGPVAAQVNEEIIRFEELHTKKLNEGDKVELFRMMGGG